MIALRLIGALAVIFGAGLVAFVWWQLGQPGDTVEVLTRMGLLNTVLLVPGALVLIAFGAHLLTAPHRWRRNRLP